MKDLIKVKSSEIENLEFRITAIDCDDTEFEQVKEAGENAETGEIYEEIYYSRTAWGREQTLQISLAAVKNRILAMRYVDQAVFDGK